MRAACALLLAVAVALPLPLTIGCAEAAHGPLAGASDAWASAPDPTSSAMPHARAPDSARQWQGYDEVLRLPAVTPAPFTSRGHQPEQQVDVRVNDLARESYVGLVTDTLFPDGSLLAELSHTGSGHGYVMRKTAGVWSYLELDPQGTLLADGILPLCVGCHGQAPSDSVFGLPRTP